MNLAIEFWRYLFTCLICVLHFETRYFGENTIFDVGYIGVEFFFILSGFLMMKHYRKMKTSGKNETALQYTIERIKRFYPELVIAWVIAIAGYAIINHWSFTILLSNIYSHFWEYLLLNATGIAKNIINFPTWYISALIIVGYFIYWLIQKNEKTYIEFIAPLGILLVYSWYIYHGNGGLDYHLGWERIGTFALSRAFGGISIGCILWCIHEKVSSYAMNKVLGGVIECIIIFLIYKNIVFASTNIGNFTLLVLFPLLILFEYNQWNIWSGVFNNKLVAILGKNSLNIYLNQMFYMNIWFMIHEKTSFSVDASLFLIELTILGCIIGFLRKKLGEIGVSLLKPKVSKKK